MVTLHHRRIIFPRDSRFQLIAFSKKILKWDLFEELSMREESSSAGANTYMFHISW